jgi:2-methylcitrate dehydratase PrpD
MAAFANGICAHDLELDDSHSPSRTHAASVVVPAALAAAELGEDVTGDDLLSGIIAGYDVQVRLSKAMGVQQQFDRGFHPTAVCGAVGAAVAASRVLRLPPVALRSSIALAASQSSGLLTFEEDTSHMVKSFQTGIAARNGVTAAAFARQGFVGSPDVLTGRHNLLTPFGGPAPQLAQLLDGLGSRYDITQTSIKRHACCGQTHSAVDGTLTLLSEHGLQWQDIDAIEAEVSHGAIDIVDGNPLWTHNIQYVLALAAHEGAIRPEHFSESWTTHPEIHALAEKVRVRGNDVLQSRFPAQKGAIVTIRTSDGEFSITSPMPVGSPGVPLPEAAVRSKFDGMAGAVLETAEVSELWDLMMGLDQNSTLGDLFARVSGVRP